MWTGSRKDERKLDRESGVEQGWGFWRGGEVREEMLGTLDTEHVNQGATRSGLCLEDRF